MGFQMQLRTIDSEVMERLAKACDIAFLLPVALVLTTVLSASGSDAANGFYALMVVLSTVLVIRGLRLYEPQRWQNALLSSAQAFSAAAVAGGVSFLIAKLTAVSLPLVWISLWCIVSEIYFLGSRLVAKAWAKPAADRGQFNLRVAIVGGGPTAEDAINLLEASKGLNIEVVGLFDDRFDNRSPASIRKHKKVGSISELAPFVREKGLDLIIVAIPLSAETRLLSILKRLWELPVDIRISGAAGKLKLARASYSYLGDLPLLTAFERPLSTWDEFLKSIVDRGIALAALIGLSPVMLGVALAVKLESKGPVIFKQKRFGFNNQLVEVFKFRSMYTDMSDAQAAKLVTKDDPRVTRVGRIIRKTSLDELPQLFNVLLGTLSLVGPRPHATQAKAAGTLYDDVVDGYFARHKVKPGITGWAQINGWRGETDTREKIEQRVKHDLEYIDQWSLGFDLYILAKTPLALLKSENAY
jgi:Undecaprenyl-phosphate glucose phosphotransferase